MKMVKSLATIPIHNPLFDALRSNPGLNKHVDNPVERNTKKETPLLKRKSCMSRTDWAWASRFALFVSVFIVIKHLTPHKR